MPRFDRYLAVDWSAASSPRAGADSIWIASCRRLGDPQLVNPPTRRLAEAHLRRLLDEYAADRCLVCVDVALGYPAGSPELFGVGAGWRAMWEAITTRLTDDDRNRNDRFEVAGALNRAAGDRPGPFWGRPRRRQVAGLEPTKPASFPVPEFRECEIVAARSLRRPGSVWQLLGTGSVGSQTLTALPVLDRLLVAHPGRVDVWPFTTGLRPPETGPGSVVVAEAWPTWFTTASPPDVVRDAHQVSMLAERMRSADASGELDRWFAPSADARTRGVVEAEEGWILGVT